MATATLDTPLTGLAVEPALFKAINGAVASALTMCNCRARCVGLSSVPAHDTGIISGLVGVHGNVSGFVTVNMAERFALRAVGGLMQDTYDTLNAQVVDGVGEISNIIAGGIKSSLGGTPWAFTHITVPSVIVGSGYRMAYARGLEFVCGVFEHVDPDAVMFADRMLQVSMSLLRL